MIKQHWLAVVLIISWAYLFGDLAVSIKPASPLFEGASVICGASVGLLVSWLLRFLVSRFKK